MRVTQYRPAFFTGFENEQHDVETLEQLLAIPFVKRFSEIPFEGGKPWDRFHRYSLAHDGVRHLLMAEYRAPVEWWVVAIIDDPGVVVGKLPEWEPPPSIKA